MPEYVGAGVQACRQLGVTMAPSEESAEFERISDRRANAHVLLSDFCSWCARRNAEHKPPPLGRSPPPRRSEEQWVEYTCGARKFYFNSATRDVTLREPTAVCRRKVESDVKLFERHWQKAEENDFDRAGTEQGQPGGKRRRRRKAPAPATAATQFAIATMTVDSVGEWLHQCNLGEYADA
jgi:hypothetical protein